MRTFIITATLAMATGCGGGGNDPSLPFGETAVVVVVNPVPNDGNTASLPAFVAPSTRTSRSTQSRARRASPTTPAWPCCVISMPAI